jgi:hypothetical protein
MSASFTVTVVGLNRNTSASNDNLQACAPCDLLFAFVSAV